MDGYIRHCHDKIRSFRHVIAAKYAATLPLVVFILMVLLLTFSMQSPDQWTEKEIVFSHLSRERVGFSRWDSDVLNTEAGEKYLIQMDEATDELITGQSYTLVYSKAKTIAGLNAVEALFTPNRVYREWEASAARWERERLQMIFVILGLCVAETVALLLVDRLWCANEHEKIREIRSKIARRKGRSVMR